MTDAGVLTRDEARPPEPGAPSSPTGASRRWLATAGVVVAYLALSLLANRGAWAHGIAHSMPTSAGNDGAEEMWFLAQTPWVLLHGHNPFANDWLNTPVGLNLMDNTSMPLLGIIGFPITLLWGPIATYNVMLDLAIFASALSFFLMARRFVSWWPAAFVGGLAYGFSSFTAATANGHLFLLFQAVPPLVILFVDRCLRSPSTSPWWAGVAVGLCFVAEFYVSTEAFASLVVMTGIATVIAGVYALVRHLTLDRRRLVTIAGCAAIVVVVGVGYGAYMAVDGPEHITGPAQPASAIAGVAVDPVGLAVPTSNQQFTLGHVALGDSLVADRDADWKIVFDSPSENGSYVGIPLLIALVVGAVLLRRKRFALFCTAMAASAVILSLGSHLHLDGHRTAIPLPFIVIAHLPLLESSIPARWVTYFWLFAALLLALILDAVFAHVAGRERWGARGATAAGGLLALIVLLPLVPAWPYGTTPASVPTWFTTSARVLPPTSSAVIYPYASASDASAMLWQATARMDFKMPGGYAIFASPDGSASFYGQASPLQAVLAACEAGTALPLQLTAADVRAQLDRWHTKTVVVVPTAAGAACATPLFTSALGRPQQKGGVLVWLNLRFAS